MGLCVGPSSLRGGARPSFRSYPDPRVAMVVRSYCEHSIIELEGRQKKMIRCRVNPPIRLVKIVIWIGHSYTQALVGKCQLTLLCDKYPNQQTSTSKIPKHIIYVWDGLKVIVKLKGAPPTHSL